MNCGTMQLLQIRKENAQTIVAETRKKIKRGMINLMHLILTIPAERLTEEEVEIATVLVKSRAVQEVWEKTKKK